MWPCSVLSIPLSAKLGASEAAVGRLAAQPGLLFDFVIQLPLGFVFPHLLLHAGVIQRFELLRHIKNFLRIYLSKNGLKLGSAKMEVVRSTPQTGTLGKAFIEKRWKQSKK